MVTVGPDTTTTIRTTTRPSKISTPATTTTSTSITPQRDYSSRDRSAIMASGGVRSILLRRPFLLLLSLLLLLLVSTTSTIYAHEDHTCELQSLVLSNAVEIYPTFSPQQHDYYCTQRSYNQQEIVNLESDNEEDQQQQSTQGDVELEEWEQNVPEVVRVRAIVHREAAQRVRLLLIHQGDQPFDASITAPAVSDSEESETEPASAVSSYLPSLTSSTLSALRSKFIRNMKPMSTSKTNRRKQRSSPTRYYSTASQDIDDNLPSIIYELKDGIASPPLSISQGNTTFIIQVTGEGAVSETSPSRCQRTYRIHCDTSLLIPPMFAHIVGLLNQAIGIRVVPNEVYNLLNDFNVQINGRFIYIADANESDSSGSTVAHSHSKHHNLHNGGSSEAENFAYLHELGILTAAGARIEIRAGSSEHGLFHVLFNGHHMDVGDNQYLVNIEDDRGYRPMSSAFVHLQSKSQLTIQISSFSIDIINKNNYLEMRINFVDWENISSHGLIGQTWRRLPVKRSVQKPLSQIQLSQHEQDSNLWIEGDVTHYLVPSNNLFGSAYKFRVFDSQ